MTGFVIKTRFHRGRLEIYIYLYISKFLQCLHFQLAPGTNIQSIKVQSNFQLAVKVNDDGEKMLLLLLPLGKCKCALSTLYSHQSSTISEFPCGLINDCVGVYLT